MPVVVTHERSMLFPTEAGRSLFDEGAVALMAVVTVQNLPIRLAFECDSRLQQGVNGMCGPEIAVRWPMH